MRMILSYVGLPEEIATHPTNIRRVILPSTFRLKKNQTTLHQFCRSIGGFHVNIYICPVIAIELSHRQEEGSGAILLRQPVPVSTHTKLKPRSNKKTQSIPTMRS